MTEKELREIKRRFRPERSNIPRIEGCFVNEAGTIVSRISQSISIGDEMLNEKLLGVMKKTLSGTLGTNLTDISFSTRDVTQSEEHKLLMTLRNTRLEDKAALEAFFSRVIETVKLESNYAILLASDVYDVPSYSKDGSEGESREVFSYIIAAVCPLKNMPEALAFKENDSLFHIFSPSAILSPPALGFMFPTFDDRRTNIYSALYYTRSVAENYPDFVSRVFAKEAGLPPKAQKLTFDECLENALSEDCTLDVIRSVHAQVEEMIEAHKESRDPEPLTVSKATVKNILAGCGVEEEKLEELESAFDESFGKNATLSPKNIVATKKFELCAPDVTVKVDPAHRDLVTTQVIGGKKYLLIRLDGGATVNGININVDD